MRSSTSAVLVVLVFLVGAPGDAHGWAFPFGGASGFPLPPMTHHVTDPTYGAVCDGHTDDTAAIRRAFAAVRDGDTLLFPPDATCIISEPFVLSNLSDVTIVGQGSTLRAAATMPGAPKVSGRPVPYPMLDFRLASALEIHDLTIDANSSEREVQALLNGDDPRDRVHGGSSSLMFYAGNEIRLFNVEVLDSWHDGVYFDGMQVARTNPRTGRRVVEYRHTTDVFADGLRVVGAGRNTLTIGDCIGCQFQYAFLSDATAGGFDIEPYHAEQVVADVVLERSVVNRIGRQCIHASNGYLNNAAVIESVTFHRNTVSQCGMLHNGGQGTAFVLGDVVDVHVTDNRILAIDLSARRGGTPSRSLIDLALSKEVSITGNVIERITLDASRSSVVYFWDDTAEPGFAGNQSTNDVSGNTVRDLNWIGDSGLDGQWCWVAARTNENYTDDVNRMC